MTHAVDYNTARDEALVTYSREGNDRAFQELMRRYIEPIYIFSRQYARTPDDAEDIVQDTFYKAWKNLESFTEGRNWRPWLYTIARNTALDYVKKRRLSAFSEFDDEESELAYSETIIDPEPLPDEIFHQKQLGSFIATTMADIHPDHRAVILMHYHDDMTFEEIAASLGKPMNTVKSWHRRALAKMRERLLHQKDKFDRTQ